MRKTNILIWRQRGMLTIFTAVIVLVLMTLMLLYAARIGLFEQRTSANESRQKIAFHVAEAVLDRSLEYLTANGDRVLSSSTAVFSDGTGGFRNGWFADNLWSPCPSNPPDTHPCGGDLDAPNTAFWYDADGDGVFDSTDSLPVPVGDLPADTTARVSLLMCFVNLPAAVGSCDSTPPTADEENEQFFVLTALVYGYADCTDPTDVDTCQAEATIAKPLSNVKSLRGTPQVPLTTKSVFPPGGTAEVVPNPDGGGVGVPLSAWTNTNLACGGTPTSTDGYGDWATCEMHEWYDRDEVPDGVACDQPTCGCTLDESISYSQGQTTYSGIDIVLDDEFPCDLFEYYFGVPRQNYELIKASATIIGDCNGLDSTSSGLYWVSGASCHIASNVRIGSPTSPVILVSAATTTKLAGGATIFGLLYVFDGEDANATLESTGNNAVHGGVVVDANMGNFNGTFQIVYSEGILTDAASVNGVGGISGGWRDFGLPELDW